MTHLQAPSETGKRGPRVFPSICCAPVRKKEKSAVNLRPMVTLFISQTYIRHYFMPYMVRGMGKDKQRI